MMRTKIALSQLVNLDTLVLPCGYFTYSVLIHRVLTSSGVSKVIPEFLHPI